MTIQIVAEAMPTVGTIDLTSDEFSFRLGFKWVIIRENGCTPLSNGGAEQQADTKYCCNISGNAIKS